MGITYQSTQGGKPIFASKPDSLRERNPILYAQILDEERYRLMAAGRARGLPESELEALYSGNRIQYQIVWTQKEVLDSNLCIVLRETPYPGPIRGLQPGDLVLCSACRILFSKFRPALLAWRRLKSFLRPASYSKQAAKSGRINK